MSEIRVTTLKDTSGSNSSTTSEIASGRAKAWVNFNGNGVVAIRTSFNVSSITDNSLADFTVNFTNALASADYVWSSGVTWSTTYGAMLFVDNTYPPTTTSLRFYTKATSNYSDDDPTRVTVVVHR